jgi:hypothetical protein
MGAADKAIDEDVEAALSAIRKVISRETAGNATAEGEAVSGGDPREIRRPELRLARSTGRSSTSPEEIVALRNRISGHLDRLSADRVQAADPRPPGGNGGFASILGGETRLQEPPYPEPDPGNGYDDAGFGPHGPEEDPRFAALRGGYHPPGPEAAWPEEPRPYAPGRMPVQRRRPLAEDPGMLSGEAAAATQAAFNQLAETLMARAMGERSVEEVTRELLRTMLKQWLDENLPPLVERLVREEIERVARRGPQR